MTDEEWIASQPENCTDATEGMSAKAITRLLDWLSENFPEAFWKAITPYR